MNIPSTNPKSINLPPIHILTFIICGVCNNYQEVKIMKTIYIDVLITVNIFIDFFLILCTKKALHINVTYKRILLGSIIGGVESLIALLPPVGFGINIPLNLMCAAVIVFSTFGKCTIKTYMKRVAVYFMFSFSFCGIMIFLYTAFKPNGMEIYNDVVYFNISPILLIIITLVSYYILKIIKRLTKGVNGGGTCNIEIKAEQKVFSFCAKIDSGCTLKEPFSGNDVIIVEKSILENFSPNDKKIRLIPFESLGGTGVIKGFKPDIVKIDNKKIDDDIYIGICENILNGDIKALTPLEITNKE